MIHLLRSSVYVIYADKERESSKMIIKNEPSMGPTQSNIDLLKNTHMVVYRV